MLESLLIYVGLDILQKVFNETGNPFKRLYLLLESVAAHNLHCAVFNVACTDCEAHRHTLEFIVGKLEAGALVIGIVIFHADPEGAQFLDDRLYHLADFGKLLAVFRDRHNHALDRCKMRGEHKAVIIGMRHNQGSHQTG